MYITMMIVIIIASNFIALIYAGERMSLIDDMSTMKANPETVNRLMLSLPIRLLVLILIVIFWIYSLFTTQYLLPSIVLNVIVMITSFQILKYINNSNSDISETLKKRIWLARLEAAISIVIWMPHFVPIFIKYFIPAIQNLLSI